MSENFQFSILFDYKCTDKLFSKPINRKKIVYIIKSIQWLNWDNMKKCFIKEISIIFSPKIFEMVFKTYLMPKSLNPKVIDLLSFITILKALVINLKT